MPRTEQWKSGGCRPFRWSRFLVAGAWAAMTLGSAPTSAQVPESSDPIRIIVNNWTSQLVLANISGQLLQKLGYSIDYKSSHTQMQYIALANGDLHFQVEVWEGTMAVPFETQVTRGRIIDAGSHDAITREDWWYPSYVEDVCPGLPDWEALKGCASKLATPATAPRGRYLAGPTDWEKPDQERVKALGLEIEVVNASEADSLWNELADAFARKEPIILFNWTPNWVEAEYDGKFVDFPDHDPDCEMDPAWGVNPEQTHDCGNPKKGWLKKGVWSGFEEKWPCAFQLISNINFTNRQIAEAAAKVDVAGATTAEAAEQWVKENSAVWEPWIPACAP